MRVLGVARPAFEVATLVKLQLLMIHIAEYCAFRVQDNAVGIDAAVDCAGDNDIVRNDITDDRGIFSYRGVAAMQPAFNTAGHEHIPVSIDTAVDVDILMND